MTLHSTPFSSYTVLASANSEASDWRPTYTGAHRLLFARFFYVRSSLLFTGGLRRESSDSPISCMSVRQPEQSAHPNWRCGRQVFEPNTGDGYAANL